MNCFTLLGQPVAKARPRVTRTHTYTPQKTIDYEAAIKIEYLRKYKEIITSKIHMNIRAYMQIPKSTNKKDKVDMISGDIRPTKRPDIDNILKIVLDGLNGVAYTDDSLVVSASVSKWYSDEPRLEVEIIWESGMGVKWNEGN